MKNIWDMEGIKVIPTNLQVKKNGEAVMGAGLAKQAAERYPDLPKELGKYMTYGGLRRVHYLAFQNVLVFPTKNHWKDPADLQLIKDMATDTADWLWSIAGDNLFVTLLVPKLGCGLGGLDWSVVKPLLQEAWKDVDPRHKIVFVED